MKKYEEMTDEQLIQRLRDGETAITDFIMDKYKGLVRQKAKAMFLLGGENDDLIQEGMIGLFKAVRDFDGKQGGPFARFADLCISRQMYTAMEAAGRKKHIPLNNYVSLYDTEHGNSEEKRSPLIDTIQSEQEQNPEELFLDKELWNYLSQELEKRLSPMERRVLSLYLLGMDYHRIAEIMEKEPKAVDNAIQRVRAKASALIEEVRVK